MAFAQTCPAEPLRLAVFHTELSRDGPGLLFRDITRKAPDVSAAADRIVRASPDVLLLLDVDYDAGLLAAKSFARLIRETGGPDFAYLFALLPNRGMPTGVDMNGDGRLGTPKDTQAFGRYSGQGGMVLLSRFPVQIAEVQNFSDVLWADLDWATQPEQDGKPFLSPQALAQQRLSRTGHWIVPVLLPDAQRISLLLFHATPPAFDGPEDLNGLRNADEIRFWLRMLDSFPKTPVAIMGVTNLDPLQGDGRREVAWDLLSHPRIQDPFAHLPANERHTVDWSDIGLGQMRTDILLPSGDLIVLNQGAVWPEMRDETESRHALIWVDVELHGPDHPAMLELSAANE